MRINTETLNSQITKFWQVESSATLEKETFNSKTFTDQLKFDVKNYVTKLPFKNTDSWIPDNYQLCLKRLESLKRSLDKNHTLLTDYNEIIKNYFENGIIEKVDTLGEPGLTNLPHRPIVKPSRTTTKIRIVYDGSAKTKGLSLNESLHTGPSSLTLIFDILLRMNPIALISIRYTTSIL